MGLSRRGMTLNRDQLSSPFRAATKFLNESGGGTALNHSTRTPRGNVRTAVAAFPDDLYVPVAVFSAKPAMA
jgi:hypothetical protein